LWAYNRAVTRRQEADESVRDVAARLDITSDEAPAFTRAVTMATDTISELSPISSNVPRTWKIRIRRHTQKSFLHRGTKAALTEFCLM